MVVVYHCDCQINSMLVNALLILLSLSCLLLGYTLLWAEYGFHRKWTDWFLLYIPCLWSFIKDKRFQFKARLIFRWYDFYIGIFYHRDEHILYVFILPMVGIRVQRTGCWCWRRRGSVHDGTCPYWFGLKERRHTTLLGYPYIEGE
jgi:hypothetical protein